MVILTETLQRIHQKQSCWSSYSSNVRIDISKMYLHFSCFSDSCTVHSPMKLLYIMNYSLSLLLTEIQFSQCTNAFVLYVFCVTNQHNKDTAEYYLRHGFFSPCVTQKWSFQLPREERWYVLLLYACASFWWPPGKVLGQSLINLSWTWEVSNDFPFPQTEDKQKNKFFKYR